MEEQNVSTGVFDVGAWVGRRQAFSVVARRCSAAEVEILNEIRENKLYRAVEDNWEDFCTNRLGVTRSYADRQIREYKELGAAYVKLNCYTKIKPAEYRQIAAAVTEDGLSYGGETIPLEPENTAKLLEAVDALRRDAVPASEPVDPVAATLAKAEKAISSAIAGFQSLQQMSLDDDRKLQLLSALEFGFTQLEQLRTNAWL